jgi:hypothetical protein
MESLKIGATLFVLLSYLFKEKQELPPPKDTKIPALDK